MSAKPNVKVEVIYPTVHTRQPDGSVISKSGPAIVLPNDLITTREAASMLSMSQRAVEAMCDDGRFVEGVDWIRPGEKVGADGKIRGWYRIRREAVLRRLGVLPAPEAPPARNSPASYVRVSCKASVANN